MTIILLKKKQTNKNWREPLELRKRARDPIQDAFPYTCPKYNKNAKQKSAVWQIIYTLQFHLQTKDHQAGPKTPQHRS